MIVTVTYVMYHRGMNESWSPSIHDASGTLHDRLLHSLRRDISSGQLVPEEKMPTHRNLANRLGIGVGTVTKAYAEAERLGLLTSAVGRGTFVARAASPPYESTSTLDRDDPNAIIDLSLNLQSIEIATSRVAGSLSRMHLRPDFAQSLTAAPHAGIEWHRQTLAEWFRKVARFDSIDWRRLLITTGAQHAMSIVVSTMCRPGDVILTEAATFSGIRALAEHHGCRCVGVAMDREGIEPQALEAAIRTTGSRLLYVMPTLQNPTTRTMSRQRREEIVQIARTHDLTLMEDDVYAPLAFLPGAGRPDLVPLASLAPERTCYVSSASKAIAMGIRVGILTAPGTSHFEAFSQTLRADCYATSSIASLLACQLIKDGAADDVRGAVAQEATSQDDARPANAGRQHRAAIVPDQPARLDADAGTPGRAHRQRGAPARGDPDSAVIVRGGWRSHFRIAALPQRREPAGTGAGAPHCPQLPCRRDRSRPTRDRLGHSCSRPIPLFRNWPGNLHENHSKTIVQIG